MDTPLRTGILQTRPSFVDTTGLANMTEPFFPPVIPVRQTAPQPVVADVAGEVKRRWQQSGVLARLRPNDRVAVGVGSRGIANLSTIVRATLDVLREAGAKPFVVAAM